MCFSNVEGCCFFFNLRTGTEIIGSLSLFGSIVGVFMQIGRLHATTNFYFPFESEALWMVVLTSGVLLLLAGASGMLIYAASKRRKGSMYPYLVITGVFIFFGILSAPFKLKTALQSEESSAMYQFMGNMSIIALNIYFWICVRSFFNKLREEERTKNSQIDSDVASAPPPDHPKVTYAPIVVK